MAHTIDGIFGRVEPVSCLMPGGVDTVLSNALGPAWSVQQEVDCEGEGSIIVLSPAHETAPDFILYEKAGVARVGTVVGDDWGGDQGFASFQEAVIWIIAQTALR